MDQVPSTAAQVLVTVIPIVGIVVGGAIIILYIIFNYKQKAMMLEKGISNEHANVFDLDSFSLFGGLLTFCVGLALMLFYLLKEGISHGMLGGLIPLSVGFGLLLFFIIRQTLLKK